MGRQGGGQSRGKMWLGVRLEERAYIAQLVKNLPAMQETLVRFLVWEDLLEKG